MEYNGRKIKAYRIEEYPRIVVIEVVQKESDCPMGLPQEKRRKEYCGLDCGNTLVSVSYDIHERRITRVGALTPKTTGFFADQLNQLNITEEELKDILEEKSEKISIEKGEPGKENILYEGKLIGRRHICGFELADWIDSTNPETRLYFDLIAKDPEYIMSQCGINIFRGGNAILVTTKSSKENVRSVRDLYYTPND